MIVLNIALYFEQLYVIIDIVRGNNSNRKGYFMNVFEFKELKTWSVIFSRNMIEDYRQNRKTAKGV